MNCTTSSVESERFGLLPKPFIEESSRMTHSSPFLRVPIWRNYPLGRACLSLCFSADELSIRERDIHAAHAHARDQGLNDGHFDRFLSHFREALNEVGVEADKVEKVTKLLDTRRNAVLNPLRLEQNAGRKVEPAMCKVEADSPCWCAPSPSSRWIVLRSQPATPTSSSSCVPKR